MTDDFKVEPWRDGELSLKVANIRLILPHAQARAIGKALLAAAGPNTCATCKHCTLVRHGYGLWFCGNSDQVPYFETERESDSFGCIHWQPAPAGKDGEGEQG